MRALTSVLVAFPVAVATTVVWMIAVDGDHLLIAAFGLVGSAAISLVLLRGVRGHVQPLVAADDPFQAPPGSASGGIVPWGATLPGRIAHILYAWNLATYLGIGLFFLDGDLTATGAVSVLILVAALAHIAQAVFLRRLAQWSLPPP